MTKTITALGHGCEVGDILEITTTKSRLFWEIWRDRWQQWKWNVPKTTTENRKYLVTSVVGNELEIL